MNASKTIIIMIRKAGLPHLLSPRLLRLAVAVIIAALTLRGGIAPAQSAVPEIEREQVFSASRYAQDAALAPASVTVITAREIRQFGYRTLADVLSAVRGYHMRYDFNYDYAAVRGLAREGDFNSRILVMLDGQRINAPVTDAVGIGTDTVVDLSQVHHIEVIRGPGSALFGTNAVFGVINIVTTHGKQGAEARAEGGSFGSYAGTMAWGRTSPDYEIQLFGGGQSRGGKDRYYPELDTSETNNGIAEGLDDEETYRVMGKVRWGDLSASGTFMRRRRSVPTAPYETTFNALTQTIDESFVATARYSRTFADLSQLTLTGGANRTTYEGIYPYDPITSPDYQRGTDLSLSAQYIKFLRAGHVLTVGTEGNWVPDGQQGVTEQMPPEPPTVIFADEHSQLFGAVFAQIEWRLGRWGSFYTGVRYDSYRDQGGTANPRLAAVFKPGEHTFVRALYGTAFRAPNLFELYYQDGLTQKAPDHLAPERVHSAELAVDQQFGGLTATVSTYYVKTEDLLNLVVDPVDDMLVFANTGSPTTRGVEVELRGQLGPVTGRAWYVYQHAIDDGGGRPVDSPRHMARLAGSVPLHGDMANLAVAVYRLGERLTLNGAAAPACTATDVTVLLRPFRNRTEFEIRVRDLFDATRVDPGGAEHVQNVLVQDGRSLLFTFRQRF